MGEGMDADSARDASYDHMLTTMQLGQQIISFLQAWSRGVRAYQQAHQAAAPGFSDSNSACSIQVRFNDKLSPGTPRFVDGPDHTRLGENIGTLDETTSFDFRFEVTGRVNSGSIGHVGTQRVGRGGWTIGQDKFPNTTRDGISDPRNGNWSDDSPKYLSGRFKNVSVRGSSFAWNDGPGFLLMRGTSLTSGQFRSIFRAYATNGKQQCSVMFMVIGTYENGSWHARMGP